MWVQWHGIWYHLLGCGGHVRSRSGPLVGIKGCVVFVLVHVLVLQPQQKRIGCLVPGASHAVVVINTLKPSRLGAKLGGEKNYCKKKQVINRPSCLRTQQRLGEHGQNSGHNAQAMKHISTITSRTVRYTALYGGALNTSYSMIVATKLNTKVQHEHTTLITPLVHAGM